MKVRRQKKVTMLARKPTGHRRPPGSEDVMDRGELVELYDELTSHHETSPLLTGGDIDADWQRAESSGDEAVGGSTATPDQDIVDEIGRALGVEQPPDGEVYTSDEILKARDRHYWHLERLAARDDDA